LLQRANENLILKAGADDGLDQFGQLGDALQRAEERFVVDILIERFELIAENQIVRYLGSQDFSDTMGSRTPYKVSLHGTLYALTGQCQ
jgi:hypothetical protein